MCIFFFAMQKKSTKQNKYKYSHYCSVETCLKKQVSSSIPLIEFNSKGKYIFVTEELRVHREGKSSGKDLRLVHSD